MASVLITGGTGFIGYWLDEKAINISWTIVGSAAYKKGHWKAIPRGYPLDYIVHLAPVPVDEVIEVAKYCDATVLLASSGGVYDRQPNDYFKMKLEDENKLLASGLDVKIARIFTTCGAHMRWERYAIGNFIQQAAAGGPINVQSFGKVVRSYMYGSDLAEWLWAILLHGEPGAIYNVGSPEPHTTAELAFEVASLYEPTPKINIEQKLQYEPRPWYVPDIARARDELGLSVKVPFEDAVRRTVKDYRDEH